VHVIREAIEIIMDKYPNVNLHLVGWIGFSALGISEKHKDRVFVKDWIDINILPYEMNLFDINICALEDNQFNRCKSGLKFMQAGVLGIPSVCSNLIPYQEVVQDNIDGFLANEPSSWLACLSELIENESLRIEMGERARAKVIEKHNLSKNYLQWVNTFERVMKE
jgi:glycosyltransferase involved in cell wall biosynthesis